MSSARLYLLRVGVHHLGRLRRSILRVLARVTNLNRNNNVHGNRKRPRRLNRNLDRRDLTSAKETRRRGIKLLRFRVHAFTTRSTLVVIMGKSHRRALNLVLAGSVLIRPILSLDQNRSVSVRAVRDLRPNATYTTTQTTIYFQILQLVQRRVVTRTSTLTTSISAKTSSRPFRFILVLTTRTTRRIFFVFTKVIIYRGYCSLF